MQYKHKYTAQIMYIVYALGVDPCCIETVDFWAENKAHAVGLLRERYSDVIIITLTQLK